MSASGRGTRSSLGSGKLGKATAPPDAPEVLLDWVPSSASGCRSCRGQRQPERPLASTTGHGLQVLWVPGPAPRRRGLRPLPSLLTCPTSSSPEHHCAGQGRGRPPTTLTVSGTRDRAVGGAGSEAARRRADHPHAPAQGPHRLQPRLRRHRRCSRARRGGHREGSGNSPTRTARTPCWRPSATCRPPPNGARAAHTPSVCVMGGLAGPLTRVGAP